jgi:hypothetical protein
MKMYQSAGMKQSGGIQSKTKMRCHMYQSAGKSGGLNIYGSLVGIKHIKLHYKMINVFLNCNVYILI